MSDDGKLIFDSEIFESFQMQNQDTDEIISGLQVSENEIFQSNEAKFGLMQTRQLVVSHTEISVSGTSITFSDSNWTPTANTTYYVYAGETDETSQGSFSVDVNGAIVTQSGTVDSPSVKKWIAQTRWGLRPCPTCAERSASTSCGSPRRRRRWVVAISGPKIQSLTSKRIARRTRTI